MQRIETKEVVAGTGPAVLGLDSVRGGCGRAGRLVLPCCAPCVASHCPAPPAPAALPTQCIRDGKSIIIEGLHLDPGLFLSEFGDPRGAAAASLAPAQPASGAGLLANTSGAAAAGAQAQVEASPAVAAVDQRLAELQVSLGLTFRTRPLECCSCVADQPGPRHGNEQQGLLTHSPPSPPSSGTAQPKQRCSAQLASNCRSGCASQRQRSSSSGATRPSGQPRTSNGRPPALAGAATAAAASGRGGRSGGFNRGRGGCASNCQLWRRCVAAELRRPAPPAVALEGCQQQQAHAAPALCQDVRPAGAARAGGVHVTEHRWRRAGFR